MSTIGLRGFCIIALLLSAPQVVAEFARGVTAYNAGDYVKAAVEFLIAAQKGDVRAQLNLGLLYDQGQGVEQDYAQAVMWYTRAAQGGDAMAQANLAAMYFDGLGVEQDDKKAAQWYLKAAQAGNPIAQYNLGVLYGEGIGLESDPVQSYVWLEIAAQNGEQVTEQERAALIEQLDNGQLENAKTLIDTYSKSIPTWRQTTD